MTRKDGGKEGIITSEGVAQVAWQPNSILHETAQMRAGRVKSRVLGLVNWTSMEIQFGVRLYA